MSKILLRKKNLLVVPDEPIEKSGVIILTDYSKRRPTTGTIFDIGDEVTEVNKGDRVVFEDNARNELMIGERKLYLMNESNIMAVIE